MEIIPAIDLLEGNCVRLTQGDYGKVTRFNNDPISQALEWERKGATRIHLVDLDGAKTGKGLNESTIKEIASKINIPVQLGGGIRTFERAKDLIDSGIGKVILGTVCIENENLLIELADKYPGQIIVGIDAKDGKVATRGWLKESNISAIELTKKLSKYDISSIISTDIATDGTLGGPNIPSLIEIAQASDKPIIASGGVGSITDLLLIKEIEEYGVEGVIVGRALYDGTVDLEEAMKILSKPIVKDGPFEKKLFEA